MYLYEALTRAASVVLDDDPFRRVLHHLPASASSELLLLDADLIDLMGGVEWDHVEEQIGTFGSPEEAATNSLARLAQIDWQASSSPQVARQFARLRAIFEPLVRSRDRTAEILAYQQALRTDTLQLVSELEKLVDERGQPWPWVRDEISTFESIGAPDEEVLFRLDEAAGKLDALDNLFISVGLNDAHELDVRACPTRSWHSGGTLVKLADAADVMISEAARNPQSIYRLTGREFEVFLKRIFEGFGFQVQLTAATRDGGIDLLCMSSNHGIPLVVAVEAKRYAPERAISVDLVRSFVGANREWQANKLVYVTTSRFTKAAVDWSNKICTNLLTLVDMPQVARWTMSHLSR